MENSRTQLLPAGSSSPQINHAVQAFLKRGTDDSNIRIPTQQRISRQIIQHWKPFQALRQNFVGTRPAEQLRLQQPQKFKATVPDSSPRTEMGDLEPSADKPPRTLQHKPMAWL